jgi:hypothetical protein
MCQSVSFTNHSNKEGASAMKIMAVVTSLPISGGIRLSRLLNSSGEEKRTMKTTRNRAQFRDSAFIV